MPLSSLFLCNVINCRPVLINWALEPSCPSSTTRNHIQHKPAALQGCNRPYTGHSLPARINDTASPYYNASARAAPFYYGLRPCCGLHFFSAFRISISHDELALGNTDSIRNDSLCGRRSARRSRGRNGSGSGGNHNAVPVPWRQLYAVDGAYECCPCFGAHR